MTSSGRSAGHEISQRLRFQRNQSTNGSYNLFVEHEFPETTPYFQLQLNDHTVEVNEEQLYGYRFENGSTLVWDGETLNAKAHISLSLTGHLDQWYKDVGDWTLTKRPLYSVIHSGPNVVEEFDVVGDGAVSPGADLLYLGPYQDWSTNAGGQRIRLVVPEAADLFADPSAILDTLSFAARVLDVGCLDDSVLAIAAPTDDVDWGPVGLFSGETGFWVRDDQPVGWLSSAGGSTWVHEYVHTRQGFDSRLTSSMAWLTEGIASYYGGLLPFAQGLITLTDFENYLLPPTTLPQIALTDPAPTEDSDISEQYDYYKGRLVIAALDCKIRQDTENRVTFDDVFYRLNKYDGRQITYSWFVSLLDMIPDSSGYEQWCDQYIRSAAIPDLDLSALLE